MIAVDANILMYAYSSSFPQHERAQIWLDQQLRGTARVGLPWSSLLAFMRLSINPRIFPSPTNPAAAWQQVERWLDAPASWVPIPGRRHREPLGRCVTVPGLSADDVPDAHLAALCLEHGLQLATADRGFARFPGLVHIDPTIG